MTVLFKQEEAEIVTETLLGLIVDMSRSIDYPITYEYNMMLTSD